MTTIYQYIIKDNKTGYPEVFRTVHKGYIPKGYTLEQELHSFTIGEPEKQPEPPKPTLTDKLTNAVVWLVLVSAGVLALMLIIAVFSIFA